MLLAVMPDVVLIDMGDALHGGSNLLCHPRYPWHHSNLLQDWVPSWPNVSFSISSLLPCISILKLDPLPPTNVNRSAPITPSLLLILLLRKAFALRHAQILMRPVRVIVRAVRIRSHLGVYGGVLRNALEGRVQLLCELGGFGRGRG